MPRDVSLSDSKCWNGGQKWVKNGKEAGDVTGKGNPAGCAGECKQSEGSYFRINCSHNSNCSVNSTIVVTPETFSLVTYANPTGGKVFIDFAIDCVCV